MKEDKSTILNREFKETYRNFLVLLALNSCVLQSEKNTLTLAYYLILQDRIAEASQVFARIKRSSDSVQQNYLACFLDMYSGYPNFATAREIAAKHKDYPVPAWRKIFK